MSTRAYIGVLDKRNTVSFIYCHNDGYVEAPGLGSVLIKHFDTDRDAKKLIDLGDLSFLYDNISLKEAGELASRTSCAVEEINDCCAAVYTGSDSRSAQRFYLEDYVSPKSDFRKDAWDIEYFYLFADNEWYVSCAETEWNFAPILTLKNMKESHRYRGKMLREGRRPRGRMLREYREDNYTHCFKIWKPDDKNFTQRLFKGTISDIAFYFRLGFRPYDVHELVNALDRKGVHAYEIHDSQYDSNRDNLEQVDLS